MCKRFELFGESTTLAGAASHRGGEFSCRIHIRGLAAVVAFVVQEVAPATDQFHCLLPPLLHGPLLPRCTTSCVNCGDQHRRRHSEYPRWGVRVWANFAGRTLVAFNGARWAEVIRLSLDENLVEYGNKHETGAILCHDSDSHPRSVRRASSCQADRSDDNQHGEIRSLLSHPESPLAVAL